VVGGDLQQFGGIIQTMYFVKDNSLPAYCVQESFRIFHHPANAGQLAIEVLNIWKALAKIRFADAPDPSEPDDRPLSPGFLDAVDPIMPFYHKKL